MITPKELLIRSGTSVRRIPYNRGDTILETLRRAGIKMSTQCEQGNCGSCMFQLLKGEVELRVNNVLSEVDLDDGIRLGCQGEPKGAEVEIELF